MADETAEEIAEHFSAMGDSVNLINAIVADDTEDVAQNGAAEVKLRIIRNTDHLEIQIAKDWYAESSVTKTSYTDAVTAGKAYVAG
jgi:hypothetical protein